jgi:hypothetical protein
VESGAEPVLSAVRHHASQSQVSHTVKATPQVSTTALATTTTTSTTESRLRRIYIYVHIYHMF